MTTKPDDLAFPQITVEHGFDEFDKVESRGGLSKREYFIGQALAGLCANTHILNENSGEVYISIKAIHIADALIELLKEDTK